MIKTSTKKIRGFTLIELIVALGIFSIVMLMVSVSYFSLIYASNEVRTSTDAMDNIASSINNMVQDIRTGSCSTTVCPGSSVNSITFTGSSGCLFTYSLVNGAIQKKTTPSGVCTTSSTESVTDTDSVKINSLIFNKRLYSAVNPTSNTTARQLLAVILVKGSALSVKAKSIPQKFSIETSAAMRKISIMQ